MKIDRLIGIITILQQNKKVTAPYLAKKFEVSRRTISLGYFGSEGDLELLKGYISEMEWVRKTGSRLLEFMSMAGGWYMFQRMVPLKQEATLLKISCSLISIKA